MARFEDTAELFGQRDGHSTASGVTCDWCGTTHEATGVGISDADEIHFTYFGDFLVAECCYEQIEEAVLERMETILPWFVRLLTAQTRQITNLDSILTSLAGALVDLRNAREGH